MNVVFDWDEKAQCWEHKTEERVVYIHKIPESKYLITIGDIFSYYSIVCIWWYMEKFILVILCGTC